MAMILWHNPRCSKSREALKVLQQAGYQPSVRLYLKDTPSADEVVELRNMLDLTADEMMRRGEAAYKDLNLATATEDAQIDAMVAHPILIERPILVNNGRAVIGRPPKKVLELI